MSGSVKSPQDLGAFLPVPDKQITHIFHHNPTCQPMIRIKRLFCLEVRCGNLTGQLSGQPLEPSALDAAGHKIDAPGGVALSPTITFLRMCQFFLSTDFTPTFYLHSLSLSPSLCHHIRRPSVWSPPYLPLDLGPDATASQEQGSRCPSHCSQQLGG